MSLPPRQATLVFNGRDHIMDDKRKVRFQEAVFDFYRGKYYNQRNTFKTTHERNHAMERLTRLRFSMLTRNHLIFSLFMLAVGETLARA